MAKLEKRLGPMLGNLTGKPIVDACYDLERAIKTTAEKVVGYESRRQKNYWFDDEYQEALDKKNQAYRQHIERNTRTKKEN